MAVEMPQRTEAVEGAIVVDFPWSEARAAVSALNAAASTLDDQLSARPGMRDTLHEWEGTYRTEFDETHYRLETTASGLKETLITTAQSIADGGSSANVEQSQNNYRVEHPGELVPQ